MVFGEGNRQTVERCCLYPVTILVHEEFFMSQKLESAAPAPIDKGVIRLAYVGCGFMAQNVHLPNFSSLSDCTLVALAENRAKLARKVAERFSVAKVYNALSFMDSN